MTELEHPPIYALSRGCLHSELHGCTLVFKIRPTWVETRVGFAISGIR